MKRPLHDAGWAAWGVLAVAAVHVVVASSFLFVTDDAYISFRYARNWARGLGLGFNPGEPAPVEGYSNFLWMAAAAACERVGLAPATVLPIVSIALSVALLVDLFRTLLDRFDLPPVAALLGVVALAASPGFVIWSTGGLETMAAAWMVWRCVDGLVLSEGEGACRRAVLPALALALLRTEGIAWVAVAGLVGLAVRAVERGRRRDGAKRVAVALAVVGIAYGAYFVFRYAHFGSVLSNTATAKVEADPERVARGLDYVTGFWLEALAHPVHLLLLPLAAWRGRVGGLVVAAFAVGVPLFAVLVGGDFMTMGRLLVGGLAFGAAGLALALGALARLGRVALGLGVVAALGVSAVGALPLLDVQVVPEDVRKAYRVRFNSPVWRTELGQWRYMKANAEAWDRLGRGLAAATRPGESIVLGAIGAASYPTELYVFDRYGLVTREVAAREARGGRRRSPGHDKAVPVTFFLEDEPTYLNAELARPAGVRGAVRELEGWSNQAVRARWAPELRPVELDGERFVLVLLARTDRAEAAWKEAMGKAREVAGP